MVFANKKNIVKNGKLQYNIAITITCDYKVKSVKYYLVGSYFYDKSKIKTTTTIIN